MSNTSIVSPGVPPVPLISGRLSSILEPGTIAPVTVPTSSSPMNPVGVGGAAVSTSNGNGADAGLTLPNGSFAVTVIA